MVGTFTLPMNKKSGSRTQLVEKVLGKQFNAKKKLRLSMKEQLFILNG